MLKNYISHTMVILAPEPYAVLREKVKKSMFCGWWHKTAHWSQEIEKPKKKSHGLFFGVCVGNLNTIGKWMQPSGTRASIMGGQSGQLPTQLLAE